MASVEEGLVSKTDYINRQFVGDTKELNIRRVAVEHINPLPQTQKIVASTVDSSTFILGDLVRGIPDGTYYMGDSSPYTAIATSRVLNLNNVYKERFVHSEFIDSSISTGSITTSDSGSYTFSADDVFQTELVAKNNVAYTSATLNLVGTNVSTLTPTISFDGGSTFTSISDGVTLNVTNTSTDGIILKFVNPGSTPFGASGLSFPITFTGGVSVTLDEFSLEYN